MTTHGGKTPAVDRDTNDAPVAVVVDPRELFVFIRFHALAERDADVAAMICEVLLPTRKEEGCISAHLFRCVRNLRLFHIHSRWRDEAAFDLHGELPHTRAFLERIQPLLDRPLEVTRTAKFG